MKNRKWLWCWLVILVFSLLWSDRLLAVTIAPYFPIDAGSSWSYSWTNNGLTGTSTTTVLDQTVLVNGVTTAVFQDLDGELTKTYMTNDQNGVRVHRQYKSSTFIEGQYRSFDVVFSPPMKVVDAETTIGASLYSTGTATFTISGIGVFYMTYSLTSSIDGLDNITVPAGTYQVVKNSQTLTISGNILGSLFSETSTDTNWVASGIGIVKESGADPDEQYEMVLTATNIAPKVTPVAGAGGSISPTTPQYVANNDTVSFSITPEPLNLIDSVTGCGGTLVDHSYTTAPVTADCTVTASFYSLEESEFTWFVRQVYLDFLNREADIDGLIFWVSELESGAFDRAEMVEQFLLSGEFQGNIAPVVRLYFTYYLRLPDYDGLMFWVNAFSVGMSLEEISEEFATAQEFIDKYGALTNEEFVTQMYQNVYEREPDAEGLAFWTDHLDAGNLTRGEVMVYFSTAEEYLSLSANQVYVVMTYIGLLRRTPEQEGFDYWVGIMDMGASGVVLIDTFLVSEEYLARFTP